MVSIDDDGFDPSHVNFSPASHPYPILRSNLVSCKIISLKLHIIPIREKERYGMWMWVKLDWIPFTRARRMSVSVQWCIEEAVMLVWMMTTAYRSSLFFFRFLLFIEKLDHLRTRRNASRMGDKIQNPISFLWLSAYWRILFYTRMVFHDSWNTKSKSYWKSEDEDISSF